MTACGSIVASSQIGQPHQNDDAADDKTAGKAAIAQWEQTQKHDTVSTKDI
jgi:hypothetical protein